MLLKTDREIERESKWTDEEEQIDRQTDREKY